MALILHCRDAGFDCDAVIQADSPEAIFAQVRPHAASIHEVSVTSAVEDQLAALIKRSAG